MSINARYSITDQPKQTGKFWPTIDFEFIDFNKDEYRRNYKNVEIGNFLIGNSAFSLTYSELSRIIETCQEAQESVHKYVSLGMSK